MAEERLRLTEPYRSLYLSNILPKLSIFDRLVLAQVNFMFREIVTAFFNAQPNLKNNVLFMKLFNNENITTEEIDALTLDDAKSERGLQLAVAASALDHSALTATLYALPTWKRYEIEALNTQGGVNEIDAAHKPFGLLNGVALWRALALVGNVDDNTTQFDITTFCVRAQWAICLHQSTKEFDTFYQQLLKKNPPPIVLKNVHRLFLDKAVERQNRRMVNHLCLRVAYDVFKEQVEQEGRPFLMRMLHQGLNLELATATANARKDLELKNALSEESKTSSRTFDGKKVLQLTSAIRYADEQKAIRLAADSPLHAHSHKKIVVKRAGKNYVPVVFRSPK